MLKLAFIGALAPLLLLCASARADLRTPINGGKPILPTRFLPMGFKIVPPAVLPSQAPVDTAKPVPEPQPTALVPKARPPKPPVDDTPIVWTLPLVDRALSPSQKSADLPAELVEAVSRIEPMYNPARLDGTGLPPRMEVSAGSTSMDNVFADRWRSADPDPNVNRRVSYIAMAWQEKGAPPCDAFTKNRPHLPGDPALTAMNREDCAILQRQKARGVADAAPVPLVTAALDVPVFAAPLPGSRMKSDEFWAAQKRRIEAIQAHLHRQWHENKGPTQVGLRQ